MAITLESGPRKSRGATPQMNVTPLVDVVLVLLIVFMVIAPLLSKKFSLALPKQAEASAAQSADVPVVLTVAADGAVRLNREEVAAAELGARVERVLAARADKTVYFDADDGAPFGVAVRTMDVARAHGAITVSILTAKADE
ncbi:MAG: biopolymer transporter ExbD [Myxococcales bacterium]|nr:biopolymer transporter ExbD [Myxococcales bacterium]MBL0198073.1 biopolymer transporter ExbD [Myxococcales bacterium]HQY64017.1 biopolymer transporter ExbD [Polyangiaceae bacterium]